MRFHAVLGCLVVAFLPQLVLAANPPGQLGALRAVYDFCSKVDPSERRDFEKQAEGLVKGLSPAKIAALEKSTEYKRGYHMLQGILPELKGNDAVVACQAISGAHSQREPEQGPQGHERAPAHGQER
jgi:hypothetical protein